MLSVNYIRVCVSIAFVSVINCLRYRNQTCGIDKSSTTVVYEGIANINDYPWMGTLFYPLKNIRMTTSVVLVTKQIVIGSAKEIDSLPKFDIRARSRVVLGNSCSGPSIGIRDYALHPDYEEYPDSSLAIVQLEVDKLLQELRPICAPPLYFVEPEFYAMIPGDCNKGKMRIFKMRYVPDEKCQQFYRKSGLFNDHWPEHTTCARAVSPGACRWRSGAALVIKQDGRWRLLGFGVRGPGCGAPARFLDLVRRQAWLRSSVTRAGLPAVSRIGAGHLVLRRSLGNLQRFGHCDLEEQRHLLYSDRVELHTDTILAKTTYNLTLYANTEYACIILRAKALEESSESFEETFTTKSTATKADDPRMGITDPPTTATETSHPCRNNPQLYLRRWCSGSNKMCYGFQHVEIDFYVEITFYGNTVFTITAYGQQAKSIDPLKALQYANKQVPKMKIRHFGYKNLLMKLNVTKDRPRKHEWFYIG